MTEWEMYLLVKLGDLQSLLYAITLVSASTIMLSGYIFKDHFLLYGGYLWVWR